MVIPQTPQSRFRQAAVALGITLGLGLVALLGYGGDCKGLDKPEAVAFDNNAGTGYLLHEEPNGSGGFDCAFRCVATLISWNVIATSRSCLELYQATKARKEGQTGDVTFDYTDNGWAFGASRDSKPVCEGSTGGQVHDKVFASLGTYGNTNVSSYTKGAAQDNLYRVWRTVVLPMSASSRTGDIRKDGDLVLMILALPVRGIQPYDIPNATTPIPKSDHGADFIYQEPNFRLIGYSTTSDRGNSPIKHSVAVNDDWKSTTKYDETVGDTPLIKSDTSKYTYKNIKSFDAVGSVQKSLVAKYTYGNVHFGEGCKNVGGYEATDNPPLKWVYPDFRAAYHTTLNDVDTSSISRKNNDNFVNHSFAIGFVGAPVLQAGMFWGPIAGLGHSWNRAGCSVSGAYRALEVGTGLLAGALGVFAGFAAGALISVLLPAALAVAFSAIGVALRASLIVGQVATRLPLLNFVTAGGRLLWGRAVVVPNATRTQTWWSTVKYLSRFWTKGTHKGGLHPTRIWKNSDWKELPSSLYIGAPLDAYHYRAVINPLRTINPFGTPANNAGVTSASRWFYGLSGTAAAPAGVAATSKVRSVAFTPLNYNTPDLLMVLCYAEAGIAYAGCGRYDCPNTKTFMNGGKPIFPEEITQCNPTDKNCLVPPIPSLSSINQAP